MEVFRGESALTPKNVVRRVRKIQKIAESNVLSEKLRQHRKGFARRCPKAPYAKISKTTTQEFSASRFESGAKQSEAELLNRG